MVSVSDQEFHKFVQLGIRRIPSEYFEKINNVIFDIAEYPSQEQMKKAKIKNSTSLLGLYEGVPLTKRNGEAISILPDKITIFKNSHKLISSSKEDLKKNIEKTIWHEVAHYFGLDHNKINSIENKRST